MISLEVRHKKKLFITELEKFIWMMLVLKYDKTFSFFFFTLGCSKKWLVGQYKPRPLRPKEENLYSTVPVLHFAPSCGKQLQCDNLACKPPPPPTPFSTFTMTLNWCFSQVIFFFTSHASVQCFSTFGTTSCFLARSWTATFAKRGTWIFPRMSTLSFSETASLRSDLLMTMVDSKQ